ncbi:MAG TPA: hypothetical protein ACFYD3_07600 [Candidatus Hypogeohydataceae bacterium YC41]
MSRKLLGIVIGGSIGGLFFIFIMTLLFNPGIFLKSKIKEALNRASKGRSQVEDITFGWKRGIGLTNFILLQRDGKAPAIKARNVRLKLALMPLLRGQYILRELEVTEVDMAKKLPFHSGTVANIFGVKASQLAFTGELSRVKDTKGMNRPVGRGNIKLEDGFLTGEIILALMRGLGQSGEGYAFESISTNFEARPEGQVYLSNFLARGSLFDLELEGLFQPDQTMDCNATVILSKEKMGENVQKIFGFSVTNTLRIPVKVQGSLSRPKIFIKTESLMDDLLKGIFKGK